MTVEITDEMVNAMLDAMTDAGWINDQESVKPDLRGFIAAVAPMIAATERAECKIEMDIDHARDMEEIKALRARLAKIEAAAKPFATVGRIIDMFVGPAIFADDKMAFNSQRGCSWKENGEKHILTWGDFRALREALKDGEHDV